MVTHHTMKLTLFALALVFYSSSGQWDTCEEVDNVPLSEEKCNAATPTNGDCCKCAEDICEGCGPTSCPTTSAPTTNTTATPCVDCPYNVSLTGIANISIEECPEDTPTPTVWSHGGGHHHHHHGRRKLSSVEQRRRLWGGYHPPKPWDKGNTPSPIPWMADRVCIYRDADDKRRRLWGWRSHEDDGCGGGGGHKPTRTPAPTPSGFTQWYKDKCDIKEHKGWSHGYSKSSYGHTHDEQTYGQRYTSWSKREDRDDEFLTEVCVTYTIRDIVNEDEECGEVESVFLGICENNNTDFNSSTLSVDDLSDLIVSINNNSDDENIQSVGGAEMEDTLGILVVFEEGHTLTEFELCLGNVTVDTEFNDDRENIDIGDGWIGINGMYQCGADGLPCLNFFFDIPCPPETTDDVDCECTGGMTSLTLLYNASNGLNATVIGYYDARNTATVLCEFENVSPGTEIECSSDPYYRLRHSTFFVVHYIEDNSTRRRMGGGRKKGRKSRGDKVEIDIGDCSGKFQTSCHEQIIGTTSNGCDDLEAVAFVAVDGTSCDHGLMENKDEIAADNALINGGEGMVRSPLTVLEELDPYVLYSLIGILFTFGVLTMIACCVCMGSRDRKVVSSKDSVSEMRMTRHMRMQETMREDHSDADSLVEMTGCQ